ncbi:hypothetical protein Dda_7222 [Drechslerella dactyloides]|uniref:Uncharacterized protein n=1 Tax=Drechslerella dactyloides TaxID=74499 RepID=A0AAD6NI52_DREDA|nr:hypothetical protein Dda_7222 [Drechslerella dactyloides]
MSLRHTIRSLLTGPQAQAPSAGPPQQYAGYPPHSAPAGGGPYPPPQPSYASYHQQQQQQQQQQQFYSGYPPPAHQQQHHQPHYNNHHHQQYPQPHPQSQPFYQPQHQPQHQPQFQPQHQSQFQPQHHQPHSQFQPQPHQQPPANPCVPQNLPPVAPVYHQPHPTPTSPTAHQQPSHFGAPPPVPSATHPSRYAPPQQSGSGYPSTAVPYDSQLHQQEIPTSPPPPYALTPHPSQTAFSQPPAPHTTSQDVPLASPTASHASTSYQPQYAPPNKQEQELLNNLARPAEHPQPTSSTGQSRDILSPALKQNPHQLHPPASSSAAAPLNTTAHEPQSPGAQDSLATPSGIIHPSLLAQWTAATKQPSSPQTPLGGQTQPQDHHHQQQQQQQPPKSDPNFTYPQAARPGHKSTGSVNRSLTFSKKNSDGSPNWSGILLTIDGLPSETFTRFVDGIYSFAGQDHDPLGLTPDQMRVLFERLEIPDKENHPKRIALNAHKMNAMDPVPLVNTGMIQFYTTFNLTYITEANLMPLITRDGFQQYMTTKVLVDPSAMHIHFNRLLAKFGHHIIDPLTKAPFGSVQIDRSCYPAIPNDQYVGQYQKQHEALTTKENTDFTSYGNHQPNSPANSAPMHGSGYSHQSSWGI